MAGKLYSENASAQLPPCPCPTRDLGGDIAGVKVQDG